MRCKLLSHSSLFGALALCIAGHAGALSPRMPSIREVDVEFERGAVALDASQRQLLIEAFNRQPLQCVAEVFFSFRSLDSEHSDEQMWRLGKARATYVQELLQKSGGWPEGKKPNIFPTSNNVHDRAEPSTVTFIGC